jgi:hypothetical protein
MHPYAEDFSMKKIVRITVEGGIVQHVDVPHGVQVIVRDYDVDGQEDGLQQDENGDCYIECVWEESHCGHRKRI